MAGRIRFFTAVVDKKLNNVIKTANSLKSLLSQACESTSLWNVIDCLKLSFDETEIFHLAIENSDAELVKLLLSRGNRADGKLCEKYGWPLHTAVEKGSSEIVASLLSYDASVDALWKGNTALHVAAERGLCKIGSLLLKGRANINFKGCHEYTPLHMATENGRQQMVELLVSHKADIDAVQKDGKNALHIAVEKEFIQITKFLLEHGASVNSKCTTYECTPLHMATVKGCQQMVKLLVSHKADIDAVQKDGKNALHIAVQKEFIQITKFLLKNGASVNSKYTTYECTPLHIAAHSKTALDIAIQNGFIEITSCLLQYGASIRKRTAQYGEDTHLHVAVKNGYEGIVILLLSHNVSMDELNKDGETALHVAVKNGFCHIANLLLDTRASINFKDNNSYTPLHMATKKGHEKMVKLLLCHNADIDAVQKEGKTALYIAIEEGFLGIAKFLVENTASVNTRCPAFRESTPLHIATEMGQEQIVRLLLSHDADVHACDTLGKTALHIVVQFGTSEMAQYHYQKGNDNCATHSERTDLDIAVEKGKKQIVRLLLNRNADIDAVDNKGRTALYIAIKEEFLDMAEYLLQKGASVNVKCTSEKTKVCSPLHKAVSKNQEQVIKLLLKHCDDIDAVNEHGMTPLHIAIENRFLETAEYLLQNGASVNKKCTSGYWAGCTPLFISVKKNLGDFIRLLSTFNSKLIYKEHHVVGITPLYMAVRDQKADAVEALLECGAELNETIDTPLKQIFDKFHGPNVQRLTRIIIKDLVKRKAADQFVSDKILRLLHHDNATEFRIQCENEIKIMKRQIGKSSVCFFDVLTNTENKFVTVLGREKVMPILESERFKLEFPIYGNLIKKHLCDDIRERENLKMKCQKILFCSMKEKFEYPYACAKQITSHLPNKVLKEVITLKSTQPGLNDVACNTTTPVKRSKQNILPGKKQRIHNEA